MGKKNRKKAAEDAFFADFASDEEGQTNVASEETAVERPGACWVGGCACGLTG